MKKMAGEFMSLRAQFTEFKKSVLSGQEVKSIRQELHQLRGAAEQAETAAAQAAQNAQALQQMQQDQQKMRSVLERVPDVKQLEALQRQMNKAAQSEQDSFQKIRQELSGMHQQIQDSVMNQLQGLQSSVEKSSQTLQQVQQKGDQASKAMQDMQSQFAQAQHKGDQTARSLEGLKQETQKATQEMQQNKQKLDKATEEVRQVKRRADEAKSKIDEAKSKIDDAARKSEQSAQEAKKVAQEVKSAKDEASGAKGAVKESQAKIKQLERKTEGMDEISKTKVIVEDVRKDFFDLKKQLQDKGVLGPPKPEDPEVIPVGTLELGEDIFSARLLMRLGFIKGRSEELVAALEEKEKGNPRSTFNGFRALRDYDSDEDDDSLDYNEDSIVDWDDNVTGLDIPDVAEGDDGYITVNYGFLAICVTTLVFQLFIVALLLFYGLTTGDCFDPNTPPTPIEIFMLHFSKAAATACAGFLMGKDLMDLVNYAMTSVILEAHMGLEMLLFILTRIFVALLLAIANVVMFMGLINPFDVWVNMTALGFVSEMGGAMLDVCKRGFFGHHISKTTTNVNFALNFISQYPVWFDHARNIAVVCAGIFILACGTFMFWWPDMYKDADGYCPISDGANSWIRLQSWGIWKYHDYKQFTTTASPDSDGVSTTMAAVVTGGTGLVKNAMQSAHHAHHG